MSNQGFKSFNSDVYIYQESTTNQEISVSMGIDSAPPGLWCLAASTIAGSNPNDTGRRYFTIDPNPGGPVTINANGGVIKLDSPVQFTGGFVLAGDIVTDNAAVSTAANSVVMQKDRAGAAIVTGDALGQIFFKGFDGTAYVTGASITSTSSGTIGANRVAANMVFGTHPDSASGLTATPRLTIASTGAMTIASPDSGVGLTIAGGGLTVTGATTLNTALTVPNGGTGISSATAYAVLCGGTTSTGALQSIASVGTAGLVLTSNGAGALPTFQAAGAGGVSSAIGTANEIAVSAATGAVTFSIPSTFIAPGTISATTTVTAGTDLASTAGNLLLPTVSSTVGQIQVNGARVFHTFGTSNVFIGDGAGNFTLTTATAKFNQGIGTGCLASLTTATFNSCLGYLAGNALTTGSNNVFIGNNVGQLATTTGDNIAIGDSAGSSLTTGSGGNTMVGPAAGSNLVTGANNILLGFSAGGNYNAAESGNIVLGRGRGTAGESNVTTIGYTGNNVSSQTKCFIDGVVGVTTDVNDAIAVLVSSTGQFGTVSSSIRYKENVSDMLDESDPIMHLRPVVFNYITSPDVARTGLIAEEVLDIMPSLVFYNEDGQPDSVKYHELPVLLLNELQKAVRLIDDLQARVAALEDMS